MPCPREIRGHQLVPKGMLTFKAQIERYLFYFTQTEVGENESWEIRYVGPTGSLKMALVGTAACLDAAVWFAEDWLNRMGYVTEYESVEAELIDKLKLKGIEPIITVRDGALWDF